MAQKYSHIFFDLDHTLWDFERNANECLIEIFDNYSLDKLIESKKDIGDKSLITNNLEDFLLVFDSVNHELWRLLDKRQITHQELRQRRFQETLGALGVEVSLDFGNELNEEFLRLLPKKAHLIEGAKVVLDYLAPKYELHIITNGFDEIQANKLQSSEISHYFGEVITNEKANFRKPEKGIFEYALNLTNAGLNESLMIGDNYEADICGAIGAGLDTVYYNPDFEEITGELPTFEIRQLIELTNIL